jgi:mannose-6-phosphate isomerase-like protein (cupin superfamily)
MSKLSRSGVIRLAGAQASMPRTAGEHSVSLLQRGTLDVRLALSPPERPSQLTQHEQDEVYVVIRGRGVLLHDGQRDSFQAGDLLFVAAGTEHRFEDFTDNLVVWIVF